MRALLVDQYYLNKLMPSYLLEVDDKTGEDESLRSYVKNQFLKLVPKEERSFSYVNIELDGTDDVTTIIQNADTFCFSSTPKLIDVRPFNRSFNRKEEKALENYFSNPAINTVILFESAPKNIDFLRKVSVSIDCKKATEKELIEYAQNVLMQEKYYCAIQDLRKLIYSCNLDFGKVSNELSKLLLYCNDTKKITMKDIQEITILDPEFVIFDLSNALNSSNYERALNIAEIIDSRGDSAIVSDGSSKAKGTVDNKLFSLLKTSYRRQFQLLISKASDEESSRVLGLSYKALETNKNIATRQMAKDKRYIFKLKELVEYFNELEYRFKTSQITPSDALDLAIYKIISLGK